MSESSAAEREFKQIDTDNDGFVTADELKASLRGNSKISKENADVIVRMADEDGDRRIDLTEYTRLVREPAGTAKRR